jgi:exo-1,4-beta-D-glucosaminidase
MFEAFSVNKPGSTGVIQWMLNSAWPETYWQLYDWYLMPNGAYFGTRAACRPVNLVFNYGDGNIYAVNDGLAPRSGLRAEIRVLDSESRELLSREVDCDLPENSSQKILEMPRLSTTPVYFLQLRLLDGENREIARNFYWLSTTKDVLDFAGTEWFVTPNRSFADFKALRKLPKAVLETRISVETSGPSQIMTVELENSSDKLAFFVELTLVAEPSGEPVLPVYWEDNYVSLLPGERRALKAEFAASDLGGGQPVLRVSGLNLGGN